MKNLTHIDIVNIIESFNNATYLYTTFDSVIGFKATKFAAEGINTELKKYGLHILHIEEQFYRIEF